MRLRLYNVYRKRGRMKRRDVPFLRFTKRGSVLENAANLYYFIHYFIRIFPAFINAANLYYFIFIHIWPLFINAAKLFYGLKKTALILTIIRSKLMRKLLKEMRKNQILLLS